jgi:hypothetical protein
VLHKMIDEQIGCCRRQLELFTDRGAVQSEKDSATTVSRLFASAAVLHAEADLKALELCRSALQDEASRTVPTRCIADTPAGVIRMQRRAKRVS